MRTDQEELDGLRSLDREILTEIHNRYYPEIYRYACYRLGNDSEAEDIASDVFMCLLEAVTSGGGPRTSLRGWLLATTANRVNDHYRKTYARPDEVLPDDHADDGANPGILVEQGELNRAVQNALRRLTPEQQHVLALRFANRLSLEEAAAVMGKKVNAIKALQFRALASLRRLIEGQES